MDRVVERQGLVRNVLLDDSGTGPHKAMRRAGSVPGQSQSRVAVAAERNGRLERPSEILQGGEYCSMVEDHSFEDACPLRMSARAHARCRTLWQSPSPDRPACIGRVQISPDSRVTGDSTKPIDGPDICQRSRCRVTGQTKYTTEDPTRESTAFTEEVQRRQVNRIGSSR